MNSYYWKATDSDATISQFTFTKRKPTLTKNVKVNAIIPDVKDAQQLSKTQETLQEFGSRTSIMGVMQIATRQLFWKLFWVLVSMSCATMAVVQSWRILQDFIEGKTVQSTSYSTIYEFPSITLCSNIHLDAGRSIYINSTEFNGLSRDNLQHLVSYLGEILQKENETGQSLFGLPMRLRQCEFNKKPCNRYDENDVFHFDTALYGNCLTYNIGTKKPKLSKPNYYLSVKIPTDRLSRRMEWNDNFVSVWIHPPASAPVLYRHEGYHIYPGDSVDIKLQVKKITRLPKSGNDCIKTESDRLRFSSVFYTDRTPYLYTVKACIYSLIYEIKRKTQNCLDPAVPRNDKWKAEWQTGKYSLCLPGTNTVSDDNEVEDVNDTKFDVDSNCSFPCSESIVDYTITSTSAWSEALVDKTLKNSKGGFSEALKFDTNYAELKVGLGSSMTEEVNEDYKYTTSDFAGIIGGNIGIWIGLCAISLAEIIELMVNLVAATFKQWRKTPT